MPDDLYFIAILARALRAPVPSVALREAFAEIERLGQEPRYAHGYRQFRAFMAEVAAIVADGVPYEEEVAHALMVELATQTFEGDASSRAAAEQLVASRPEWRDAYEAIRTAVSDPTGPVPLPAVCVRCDDRLVGRAELPKGTGSAIFTGIIPGRYTVALASGRVLWQGRLTAEHVLWSHAFPAQPLKLAADTEGRPEESTWETEVLDGTYVLRVFPGLEAGQFEIAARASGGR